MKSFVTHSKIFHQVIFKMLIVGFPVIFLLNWGYSEVYKAQVETIEAKAESRLREPVSMVKFQMENLFNNVYNDLNLIRNADEFIVFLKNPGGKSYQEVSEMFIRVMKSKPDLRQLRYLDTNGQEIIRVDRKEDYIFATEGNDLQNKSGRYYFISLSKMEQSGLYVSDFDLNVENGQIVYPYEPMVRFAIPVMEDDITWGYLVINYDGYALLRILDESEGNKVSSINIGILDRNHIISTNILHINEDLIQSFLKSDSTSIDKLNSMTGNRDSGSFRMNGESYFFRRLVPDDNLHVTFDFQSGMWKIISSFNSDIILEEEGNFLIRYEFVRYILLSSVFFLILMFLIINEMKKEEHFLLLASGYISEYTYEGILITDSKRRVVYCNKVFENTYGYELDEISGKTPNQFLKGESLIKISGSPENPSVWEGNLWDIGKNGTYILKYLRIKAVLNHRNNPVYYIGIYSEPKIIAEGHPEVFTLSHHLSGSVMDYLTPVFDQKFEQIERKAVILIKFEEINKIKSLLSHSDESRFISDITQVFTMVIRNQGMVVSPSQNMVVVILPMDDEDNLKTLMDELDTAVSSHRFIKDSEILLNYISGIAIAPEHGTTGEELINNAYIALEALTKIKKSKYLIYNDDIFRIVRTEKIIREEVNRAFAKNEFSVVYQLQQKTDTLETTGVEALVRWNNAKLGNIRPDFFIPVMEESNQIKRLGKYILGKIIEDFEELIKSLPKDFRISLNLSSQEFDDTSLVADLIGIIDKSGISRKSFCFEITETTLVEKLEMTNEIISHLHENKIIVAIDDFGTGYSSLNYLKKLNADKIKIDRIFIKDYPDTDDGKILKAIIKMIKEIGIRIIIEGVETEEQLEFIRNMGCEEFQGYLSSKPVPLPELKKLL